MLWFFLCFTAYLFLLISERALAALSPHELEGLRAETDRAARRSVWLSERLRPVMAALLLARILLVLVMSIGVVQYGLFQPEIKDALYHVSVGQQLPGWLVWGVIAVLVLLLLGLLLWGAHQCTRFKSSRNAFILKRLSWFILFWYSVFSLLVRQKTAGDQKTGAPLSRGTMAEPSPALSSEKRELELLKSIVQFGDVTIKQVMQPRSKVMAVDFKTRFPDLLEQVHETGFSRMPVIDEDLDNITGILYVKDLLPYLDKSGDFEWQSLIRTNIMLVPESKRGSELLQEFKEQKMHMAIVVDEYGGSSGIVTLEDILEEVTGDIRDEFDEESEIRYRKIDNYNYLFEGQILLNDVCRITGLPANAFDTYKSNSDTLAGLALELRGDIPAAGEEISFGDYLITVLRADNRRIHQIKLTLEKLHSGEAGLL